MNEIEDGRERSLADEADTSKTALAERIKAADWRQDYSSDASARGQGATEISRIYADINALAARDMSAAKEVWEANAPKNQRRPANLDRGDTVTPARQDLAPEKPKSGPGSERSIRALDREMAKSQLSEGDWRGRGDLSKVMTRLEALSHVNPTKAIELWDKYRPGDQDKPIFIDNDDRDPAVKAAAPPKQAPAAEKGKSKEAAPELPEDPILDALRRRYLVADDKYYKRDTAQTLAFQDHGRRLTTKHDDAEIAISMVELAQAKGWDTLKVKGSEAFRREVWLQAQLRGLEVQGFKPQAVDLARLSERQADQNRPAIGTVNTIEKGERIRTHPEPTFATPKDEPNLKLTDSQQIALDALKAVMRGRGDSEKAVAMAETVALEQFQTSRVHVGKLVEQGVSPFDNDPKNEKSPYVKLKTAKGAEVIWGADLPRAIEEAGAKSGDDVTLTSPGKRAVTVKVKDRDDTGSVIGEREITAHRNGWEMRKLDTLREEAKARVVMGAERPPHTLRTFDPEAPRAQPDVRSANFRRRWKRIVRVARWRGERSSAVRPKFYPRNGATSRDRSPSGACGGTDRPAERRQRAHRPGRPSFSAPPWGRRPALRYDGDGLKRPFSGLPPVL